MKTRKLYNGTPFQGLYESGEIKVTQLPDQKTDVKGKKAKPIVTTLHVMKKKMRRDEHGNILVLDVDQFSGKRFLLNSCGWPMNDIQIFEEAQSDSIARAALSRLKVLGSREDDGLTLEQRFERIVPSNWSSPAEYVKLQRRFAELAIKDMQNKPSVPPAAEPAAAAADPAAATVVNAEPE